MTLQGVDRVSRFIEKRGLKAKILHFKRTVETVRTASEASGYPPGSILKTLLVVADGDLYAVVLPGDKRLDFKKLAKHLEAGRVRMATPDEIRRATGLEPGEVSPLIDELARLKIIVDKSATSKGKVLVGGGSLNTLVEIEVDELVKALNPEVADVSK